MLKAKKNLHSLLTKIDRLSPTYAVAIGAVIGLLVCTPGFFYLHSLYWLLFWGAFLISLWYLGYTAEPILVEDEEQGSADPAPKSPIPKVRPTVPKGISDINVGPMKMVKLPTGTFLMGSPQTDDMANPDEQPQHRVTVSAFRIGVTPVTEELYWKTMKSQAKPAKSSSKSPITNASWYDAIKFCNRLSENENYTPCYSEIDNEWVCNWDADGYRLPTEAEWEYACRAGTATRYSFGDNPDDLESYAWFNENSDIKVHDVAQKKPNSWGLHEMHGNVLEWCWDWYGDYAGDEQHNPTGHKRGNYRVLRGGSYLDTPRDLRSANRGNVDPEDWLRDFGFRCVRLPPQHGH